MKKTVIVLSVLMAFTACQKEALNGNENQNAAKDAGREKLMADLMENPKPGYIIRTNGSADLAAVRARLQEIGAIETGYVAALNMLSVSSDAANFKDAMKGLNVKIGYNLMVKGPKPSNVADNPPSIGDDETFFNQYQWNMDAIDAPQAWNSGYQGEGVTVAVLDQGIYLNHLDLAGQLVPGRNFVNLDDAFDFPGLCTFLPDCDPNDVSFKSTGFSHSTAVSGVIASLDNARGTIGVAPKAKIMPVKVLSDYFGFGTGEWIAAGIVYAADQGVDVINMSLGGLDFKGIGKDANLVQEGLKLFNDAIQYAHSKGVTVVCAAGNDGLNFDQPVYIPELGHMSGAVVNFPSGSPHAISVSATSPVGRGLNAGTDLDIPTRYTNYGSSAIDFAAPGGDAPLPTTYSPLIRRLDLVLSPSFVDGPTHYYSFISGTSFSAPHVAGVAALIIGKYGSGTLTPAQVKEKLRSGADDLGKKGRDPYFGHGRVNAVNSLK